MSRVDDTRRFSARDQRDLCAHRACPRVAAFLRLESDDRRLGRAGLGQCAWLSHRGISGLSRVPDQEKTAVTGRPIALLVALACSILLAAPLATEAQQAGRVVRIGLLSPGAPNPSSAARWM